MSGCICVLFLETSKSENLSSSFRAFKATHFLWKTSKVRKLAKPSLLTLVL